jgi:hypothetical protein
MICQPRLAYARARIQARISRLPAPADWQRLAGARTLAAYLEEARATGLREWVRGFSGLSQAHELERGCRVLARDAVHITADWAPPSWRASIEWVGWLPLLPLIEHLARGDVLPESMVLDDELRGMIGEDGCFEPKALEAAGLDVLIGDAGSADDVGMRWRAAWRARWPLCAGQSRRNLEGFAMLVERHLEAFRRGSTETAWALRESFRDRLRVYLHLHIREPAIVFGYLGLVFLDLERLRSALLSRAVFDSDRAG